MGLIALAALGGIAGYVYSKSKKNRRGAIALASPTSEKTDDLFNPDTKVEHSLPVPQSQARSTNCGLPSYSQIKNADYEPYKHKAVDVADKTLDTILVQVSNLKTRLEQYKAKRVAPTAGIQSPSTMQPSTPLPPTSAPFTAEKTG